MEYPIKKIDGIFASPHHFLTVKKPDSLAVLKVLSSNSLSVLASNSQQCNDDQNILSLVKFLAWIFSII